MSQKRCLSVDRAYRTQERPSNRTDWYYAHQVPSTPNIHPRSYGGAGQGTAKQMERAPTFLRPKAAPTTRGTPQVAGTAKQTGRTPTCLRPKAASTTRATPQVAGTTKRTAPALTSQRPKAAPSTRGAPQVAGTAKQTGRTPTCLRPKAAPTTRATPQVAGTAKRTAPASAFQRLKAASSTRATLQVAGTAKQMGRAPTCLRPKAAPTTRATPQVAGTAKRTTPASATSARATPPKPKVGTWATPKQKIQPKSITQQTPKSKSPPSCPSQPKHSTFESIMQRVSQIRARASESAAAAAFEESIAADSTQDKGSDAGDLDEIEASEELYGASESVTSASVDVDNVDDLQAHIDALQQQLNMLVDEQDEQAMEELAQRIQRAEAALTGDELEQPEFEQRCQRAEAAVTGDAFAYLDELEQPEFDVQEISQSAFSEELMEDGEFINASHALLKHIQPPHLSLPKCQNPAASPLDNLLDNIKVPKFDINDISLSAYSEELVNDAQFEHGEYAYFPEPDKTSPTRDYISPLDAMLESIEVPEFDINEISDFAFSAAAMQGSGFPFDDAYLENIEIPEFDINEISDFAFSAEASQASGFEEGIFASLLFMPKVYRDLFYTLTQWPYVNDYTWN